MSEPVKAVFLSYAREDADAARRIAEALRAFGVEVWFDQNELRGGDSWDTNIRNQIKTCALFLPIVSQRTEARSEGYFRREWKLAVDRTHDMAGGRAFLVPVVIDDTTEVGAAVPEEFLRVQWTRLAGGQATPEFVAQVKRLLEAPKKPALKTEHPKPPAFKPVGASRDEARGRAPGEPLRKQGVPAWTWGALTAVVIGVVAALFVARKAGPVPEKPPAEAPPAAPAMVPPPASALQPASSPSAAADKSVAVLPFANLSGDKDQEYFSDGLTEEILNTLAREPDLHVPGRASSFSFKGRNISSAEVAKALNVSRLVEGSVRKSGNKVRISVSLTRAADGFSEELGTFTEELSDIFALQDKVARAVVEKLTRRTVAATAAVGLTKNAEAYDAYLRGRALQTRAANNTPEAIKFYEQAVALDPAFALAWARLAEARFRTFGAQNDRSPEVVEGARTAIDRALAAQPDLPEALIARANWVRAVKFDFAAAQRDLAQAEALQPATAGLRVAQSSLARDQDNWPDAIRLAREALQLDPQNGDFTNAYAVGFCLPRGEFVEADALFRRAMAIQGPGVVVPFGNLISLRNMWRGPEAALRLLDRMPATQAGLGVRRADLLIALGRLDEARAVLAEVERAGDPNVSVASIGGQNVRISPESLLAVGREDQARQRAQENLVDVQQQFARGNRAPSVRMAFIRAEIVLGHRESALAALQEWREEAQRMPGSYRRLSEFGSQAPALYARLGRADEAVALLRDLPANGLRPRFGLLNNLDFAAIRHDPRVQELMQQYEAWTRTLPDPVDL